jgi:eukaryotic-like serine/threonine-protein kinase
MKFDWTQIEAIVDQALALPFEEQNKFIDQQCNDSLELKREVTRLLKSINNSEGWLENSDEIKKDFELSMRSDELESESSLIGEQVDRYRILEKIGRGGMGTVYLSERADDAYHSQAAIKILRRGLDTEDILTRFRTERQILARLNHPNITHILDGGITSDGLPYFVMEYIKGKPITEYCNEKNLSLKVRLELFIQICDALQYAHKNLVIHRDLKPCNILVTDEGQVKLLDFGIAKVLADDFSDETLPDITRQDQIIFTPEYASPEQIQGNPISTASDIYTLCIVLYELLTGSRPYTLKGLNRSEMVEKLKTINLERPSKVIKKDPKSPLSHTGIKDEIDNIIFKGIRFNSQNRYESVEQLRNDIHNYLEDRPVLAKGDSRKYHFKKFIYRNRRGVSLAALSVLIMISGVLGTVWQANQTRLEAERALAATERVGAVKNFLINMITASNPWENPNNPQTARGLIDQGALAVEDGLSDQPELAAELYGVIGASYQGMREDLLAKEYLSRAMELMENGVVLDPLTEADIHSKYAGSMLRAGQPNEAKELALNALESIAELKGSTLVKSELLSMLANAQSLLGNTPEAVSNAQKASAMVCDPPGAFTLQCLNSLMDLKNFEEWGGDFEAGLLAAVKAYTLVNETETGIPDPVRLSVVGTYGNALSYNARSDQAIPLLEENSEKSKELYGDDSYRYARSLYDLSSAYEFAGRIHDALPVAELVFEIAGPMQAGNPMNSYWLHRVYRLAMDLHSPDRAENAFEMYSHLLRSPMSSYFTDAFNLGHLRLQTLRELNSTGLLAETQELLEEFRQNRSALLPDAALLAAEQALNLGDINSASGYLDEYHNTIGGMVASDIRPARARLLNARLLTLQGQPEKATAEAEQGLALLTEIGHANSPLIAETKAVLSGIHCSNGDTDSGLAMLEESRNYWEQFTENTSGISAMENIASSCMN